MTTYKKYMIWHVSIEYRVIYSNPMQVPIAGYIQNNQQARESNNPRGSGVSGEGSLVS